MSEFSDQIKSHRAAYESPVAAPPHSATIDGATDGKFIVKTGQQRQLSGSASRGALSDVVGRRDRVDAIAGRSLPLPVPNIYLSSTGGKVKILFYLITDKGTEFYIGGDRRSPDLIYTVPLEFFAYAQLDNLGTDKNDYSVFIICYSNAEFGGGRFTVYLRGGKEPVLDNRHINFPPYNNFNDYYEPPRTTYLANGYTMELNTTVSFRGAFTLTEYYDIHHPEGGTGGGVIASGVNYASGGYSFTNDVFTNKYNSPNFIRHPGSINAVAGFTPAVGGPNGYSYGQGQQTKIVYQAIPILPDYILTSVNSTLVSQYDWQFSTYITVTEEYQYIRVSADFRHAIFNRVYGTYDSNNAAGSISDAGSYYVELDVNNTPTQYKLPPDVGGPYYYSGNQGNLIGSISYDVSRFIEPIATLVKTGDVKVTVKKLDYKNPVIENIENVPVFGLGSPDCYINAVSYHPGK